MYLGANRFVKNMAKTDSRTSKSIKNSSVALVFYFINLILQFFSRKIFLDYLGAEVLGLNTTATNLLQFLNLAELGVGAAIACTLYKPLAEKDTDTINEIVSLQGWLYRRIAWIVIAGSVVLMAFFPWIFAKMPLPLWYAYASFGVLLVSGLLSYFVNYKQIVLSADQQEYKIQYSYKASMLAKLLCQILAIRFLDDGYVWWLVLEMVFAVVASMALNRVIARTYPYLKTNLLIGRELTRKYPDVLTKVKQLFFHKIGGFALSQTSPIIIYVYTTLTVVALYGNYMLIVMGVQTLMTAMFNSMNAGIGNLVAEGDKRKIMSVFAELFSIRFLFSCIMCFGVLMITPAFVSFWIGKKYVMDSLSLLLMTAILFGVLISLLLVVFCWKPYYLFRKGLDERLSIYIFMYARHLMAALLCGVIVCLGMRYSMVQGDTTFFDGLLGILVFSILSTLTLLCVAPGMRNLMRRFIRMCHV